MLSETESSDADESHNAIDWPSSEFAIMNAKIQSFRDATRKERKRILVCLCSYQIVTTLQAPRQVGSMEEEEKGVFSFVQQFL
jgi:hypothetical protein